MKILHTVYGPLIIKRSADNYKKKHREELYFFISKHTEIKFLPEMCPTPMSPRTASPFIKLCEAQYRRTAATQHLAAFKMLPFGEIYRSSTNNSSGLRIRCNKMLSATPQRTVY